MNRTNAIVAACFAALLTPSLAVAQPPAAPASEQQLAARHANLLKSLSPQTGDIAIPAAKATLKLGKDYYFLGAGDAKRVLTEGWGNPPGSVENVLGMVFPSGKTFADDVWGAVLTYEASGYIDDADAKTIDYGELLAQMREGEEANNQALREQGYPGQQLVGWAQSPTYDAGRHSLVWARQLKFDGASEDTLNYDVRLLGRYGVLSLNMVSGMSDLSGVGAAAATLSQTARFDTGSAYADFNEATDAKAEYGLAGLVAAGAGAAAAKKLGLLAVILAFGKKFIGLIAIAAIALFGAATRLFKRRREEQEVY